MKLSAILVGAALGLNSKKIDRYVYDHPFCKSVDQCLGFTGQQELTENYGNKINRVK